MGVLKTHLHRSRILFAVSALIFATGNGTFAVAKEASADSGMPQLAALPAPDVGDVVRSRGTAQARQPHRIRRLMDGSDILHGDTLRTYAETRLQVEFEDGGRLYLGDDSEMIVDEMVYDPSGKSKGSIRVLKGAFRMITGKINKTANGTMVVTTPVATIGVRGTDFWGYQEAGKLTMALLDDSELVISTPQETVILNEPMTAVVIADGKAPGTVFTLSPAQLQAAVRTVNW